MDISLYLAQHFFGGPIWASSPAAVAVSSRDFATSSTNAALVVVARSRALPFFPLFLGPWALLTAVFSFRVFLSLFLLCLQRPLPPPLAAAATPSIPTLLCLFAVAVAAAAPLKPPLKFFSLGPLCADRRLASLSFF
nr:hypothetical protein [Pandoravirus belohorizontensis]